MDKETEQLLLEKEKLEKTFLTSLASPRAEGS